MDIIAKKAEIIHHILVINDPDNLIKINRFIHGLGYEEEEVKKELSSMKKGHKRVKVVSSKNKSMLNMNDK